MTQTDGRPEVRAVAKWVRMTPRKARLVADQIRGRTVPEARTVLAFTPRAAARELDKVLRSAVANAEANHGLVGDDLVLTGVNVDDAVILKRWRAQARGRAHRIRKRTCHITIKLAPPAEPTAAAPPVEEPKPKRRARKAEPEPEQPATEGEEQ